MKIKFYLNRLLPKVLLQVLPATIFALLAIDYFASQVVTQTVLDQHRARLDRIAEQSAISIGRGLQNVVDTAESLAANDLVINSLIDASERDRYIPVLFQSLRVPGTVSARISLTDYRGRSIASNAAKTSYANEPWVGAVMAGGKHLDVKPSGMLVAVPVLVSKFAEGMIVIQLDKMGLSELFKLPIQSDAFAVMSHGTGYLYASEEYPRGPSRLTSEEERVSWIRTQTGIYGFPTVQLVVVDRVRTALAAVQRMDSFMLLAVLLSVAAVGAGIIVTALKVSKPLEIFSRGVERIKSSSDLAYRMEKFGTEEFRKLSRSFNVMLTKLERTTSSRNYVDGILNSMSEFMLVIDSAGTIQSANRAVAKFLDRDIASVTGLHISQLLARQPETLAKLLADGREPTELWLKNHEGVEIPVTVSSSSLQQGNLEADATILVLKDITEQMEAKADLERNIEELERSNADLEQFAYVASHDLKAPLRAIDSLAGMIEEEAGSLMPAESRRHLSLLRGRSNRLKRLLDSLLAYARSGRTDADLTEVDSMALVQDILDLLDPPKGLKTEIVGQLPTFTTNRMPLQQVLYNLIGNAIKHHDRGEGYVRVSCRDLGGEFEFAVSDDGPGISEEYHEKVFQMFQTLKRRDEAEGSGMGLALVDRLTRAHGGSASVNSSAGKRGSTFRFTWKKHELPEDSKHAA